MTLKYTESKFVYQIKACVIIQITILSTYKNSRKSHFTWAFVWLAT